MTTRLLFGDIRTGKISGQIDATGASWNMVDNDAGGITGVTVPEDVVRDLDLRWNAPTKRTFLAIEQDDRIQQAGPIWSRPWDDEAGVLTLSSTGLWGLFDHRKVLPALQTGGPNANLPTNLVSTTLTGAHLGNIARGLVIQATTELGGSLPLIFPASAPGSARTETFPGWKLQWVGEQLKQITQRDGGPDIRFRPRRQSADRTYIEWVMETGTDDAPQLSQAGADWIFDHTAPKSPVVRISTDEDATVMAERAFSVGNGMEENTLIARSVDLALLQRGWPLTEIDESRTTVEDPTTLLSYARALRIKSARPVEVWKVVVRAEAAVEVLPGDYCRVVPRPNNAWLGTVGERRMRIAKKSGDLGDNVTLEMYPLEAIV